MRFIGRTYINLIHRFAVPLPGCPLDTRGFAAPKGEGFNIV
jgi:hypothetical protein